MRADTVRFQRGATLIVALIFLMIMTVLGVTAMQGGNQQENMARNARDHSLAFQAAEAALRAGEMRLNCFVGAPATSIAPPAIQPRANNEEDLRNFWEGCFVGLAVTPPAHCPPRSYLDGTAVPPTGGTSFLDQVAEQPYYVIEETSGRVPNPLEPNPDTDPFCTASDPNFLCYRITARGTGGTTNARVTLRSTAHYFIACPRLITRTGCPGGVPIQTRMLNVDNLGAGVLLSLTSTPPASPPCPP